MWEIFQHKGATNKKKNNLESGIWNLEILIIYHYSQVSNINTSTYNLAKFLWKLLSPLHQSDHSVRPTKDFIQNIKRENMPTGYKMVSFSVKSLFINVPLDRTINIISKQIYDDNELRISISRNEMKELLLLCTKKVHLTFNGKI